MGTAARGVTVADLDPWAIAVDLLDPPARTYSPLESDYELWLRTLLPEHFAAPFADHHRRLWEWVWALTPGVRPEALAALFARGGAKSTSAEAACCAVGALGKRRYGWYVSSAGDQANDHVGNVQAMLEESDIAREYPEMASRLTNQYGFSRGWKQNRLRTAHGFTLDAMGLDKLVRGSKMEFQRPDFIILDDLDSEDDTPATTEKKIARITKKLLPAGSNDLAVLAIQNVVHERSIFARLAGVQADDVKPADFLTRRIVIGPVPAVKDLTYEQDPDRPDGAFRITGGTPTWEGQNLEVCQAQMDDWGLSAFLSEAQHKIQPPPGGMFDHLEYRHCRWGDIPELVTVVVWVDPAVTEKDSSDSMGIQADGLGVDGTIYRLWSWEQRSSPLDALKRAYGKAFELGAEAVGVETNQGGDTWESVAKLALQEVVDEMSDGEKAELQRRGFAPGFREAKAGSNESKVHRAAQMLAEYERGRFVHVLGTHGVLEAALRRFPKTKPYDLVDSAYWAMHDLLGERSWEGQAERGGTGGR